MIILPLVGGSGDIGMMSYMNEACGVTGCALGAAIDGRRDERRAVLERKMKWSKVSSLLSADTPTIMTVLVNALGRLVDDPGFKTFKELDLAHGLPKGSAFRAFKSLADSLVEGRDFYCCDVRLEGDAYDQLSASGRVYAGTVNGVLLAPAAQAAIALRLKP